VTPGGRQRRLPGLESERKVAYRRTQSDSSAVQKRQFCGAREGRFRYVGQDHRVIRQPQRLHEAPPELEGEEKGTLGDLALARHLRGTRSA
jgi:hypothetical protein